MSNLTIENIELGRKLTNIKNNISNKKSPRVFIQTSTLSDRDFIQCVENGIVGDITSSSISITFPSALNIISTLKLKLNQQIIFDVITFSTTFPNANTLTLIGNLGVNISGSVLSAQTATYFILSVESISPPLISIY